MIVIFLYPPLFTVSAAFRPGAAACAIVGGTTTRTTITREIIYRFVIFFIFRFGFVECRDKWFDRPLGNCI